MEERDQSLALRRHSKLSELLAFRLIARGCAGVQSCLDALDNGERGGIVASRLLFDLLSGWNGKRVCTLGRDGYLGIKCTKTLFEQDGVSDDR